MVCLILNGHVDVALLLVEDDDILEMHVVGDEVSFLDDAVEGVSEGKGVYSACARAHSAGYHVIVAGSLDGGGGLVGGYHHEQLEGHASLPATGQTQPVGEAVMRLGHVERELCGAAQSLLHLVVDLPGWSPVLYVPHEVVGVTLNLVLASLHC